MLICLINLDPDPDDDTARDYIIYEDVIVETKEVK